MLKLYCIVTSHMTVVVGNIVGFFVLAYQGFMDLLGYQHVVHWAVALACCSFIFFVSTSTEECYLTKIENRIRASLGLQPIKGFVKHYLVKPAVQIRHQRRKSKI